ncbi:uncharacterized protein A4U43_C07F27960 [Asparagus officinalis]|uniref:Uncharacterized protein n=1 Tax=Asparagus officinalis TaxID=4686 RepID=A0A5P1EFS7_ASPOF|nr:uncharacterized protein A4U43_C07F27960 [Asparagus officinalis]
MPWFGGCTGGAAVLSLCVWCSEVMVEPGDRRVGFLWLVAREPAATLAARGEGGGRGRGWFRVGSSGALRRVVAAPTTFEALVKSREMIEWGSLCSREAPTLLPFPAPALPPPSHFYYSLVPYVVFFFLLLPFSVRGDYPLGRLHRSSASLSLKGCSSEHLRACPFAPLFLLFKAHENLIGASSSSVDVSCASGGASSDCFISLPMSSLRVYISNNPFEV